MSRQEAPAGPAAAGPTTTAGEEQRAADGRGTGQRRAGGRSAGGQTTGRRSAGAALRLVVTAERLYAEHGLEGVSLRQISAAAGHGNNNAVQYHFGSKQGLIQAIIAHRLPAIDERRSELLDRARQAGTDRDVRTLLDVLMRPLAEEALVPTSHYVGFVGRVSQYPPERNPWWAAGEPASDVAHRVTLAILAELGHLPRPLRAVRLRHATTMCLSALARHGESRQPATGERAGRPYELPYELPYEAFLTDLLDMAAAGLTAPLSGVARDLVPAAASAADTSTTDTSTTGTSTTGTSTAGNVQPDAGVT